MSDKNLEMMKKFLEEKKAKAASDQKMRPAKNMGSKQKAFSNKKTGGSMNKI